MAEDQEVEVQEVEVQEVEVQEVEHQNPSPLQPLSYPKGHDLTLLSLHDVYLLVVLYLPPWPLMYLPF